MQIQDGKGRDREERNEWFRAPRRLASSDGEACCSSAHTTEHHWTCKRRTQILPAEIVMYLQEHCCLVKDLRTLIVNRENVITNMEVSDADVVKAATSGFFLVRRCCRMTTGLISSQTACRVAGVPW